MTSKKPFVRSLLCSYWILSLGNYYSDAFYTSVGLRQHGVILPRGLNRHTHPSRVRPLSPRSVQLDVKESPPDDDDGTPIDESPPSFFSPSLSLQLKVSTISFAALSLLMVSVPKVKDVTILYTAVGPLHLAGVSSILHSAAANNRLKSDTYKRLCLFLSYSSFLGLVTFGSVIFTPERKFFALIGFVYTLGMLPALRAWRQGVREGGGVGSITNLVGELKNGGIDLVKGILPCSNLNTLGYLGAIGFVSLVKLQKLIEIKNIVVAGGSNFTFLFASRLIRYSKLALLFGTVFTLKDAANRNRLEGTTFIQLNILSSLVFGSMALAAGIPTLRSPPIDLAAAVFALFCAGNGVISQMKK